jgi:hypothetical protein
MELCSAAVQYALDNAIMFNALHFAVGRLEFCRYVTIKKIPLPRWE